MEKKDVENLAELSRIELSETEKEKLLTEFEAILGYISELDESTVSGDETPSVGPVHNVFREDANVHEGGIYTEVLLESAPQRDGRLVKVKKILENNG